MENNHSLSKFQANSYDAIFFSPHLDDAVLSAGNYIYSLTKAGQKVLIISIFTAADHFPSQAARKFANRCGFSDPKAFFLARKKEDRAAAKLLGADIQHLGYIDAGFRADHLSFATVFSSHLTIGDKTLVKPIATQLKKIIAKKSNTTTKLFFPLGVGLHVDHQLVTQMAGQVWQPTDHQELWFWEDVPYRNNTGATISRLAIVSHLVVGLQPHHIRSPHSFAHQKSLAIKAYASQVESLLTTGGYAPAYDDYVECFWHAESNHRNQTIIKKSL